MSMMDVFSSSLIAAVVTVVLGVALRWQEQAHRSRAFLRGILLEMQHAEFCATEYLKNSSDKPWSPGNRIVLVFTEKGLPMIAETGHLLPDEIESMHLFFICSTEANRSLDSLERIHSTVPSGDNANHSLLIRDGLLRSETSRARIKMKNLIKSIPSARDASSDALSRLKWFEPA